MDDDGTGWHEVLVGGWSDEVCDAVVDRVEASTIGWRGPLVRTLADEDGVDRDWTEQLHRLVVAAIAEETGADLDELGSHAAWACYEQVWTGLVRVWADGGDMATVPIGHEPAVSRLLRALPIDVAAAGGADVRGGTADPLWLRGRLRVDADSLEQVLRGGRLSGADELRVLTVLQHVRGERPRG